MDLDNLLIYHEQEFTALQSQLFMAEQRLFAAEAQMTARRDGGGLAGVAIRDCVRIGEL